MAKPELNKNTVYLIDGSGYIFRAFFAIRSLRSRSGVPTNAVFGFTNMLIKLLKEHRPGYVGIAFDRKEPTFRHAIYPNYKANRPLPPEDLVPQFDLIHQVVDAFNIKKLTSPGFEADDIIATMARRAHEAGHEVVIVTGDKDFMQLVDDKTFLLDELRASRNGSEKFIDALAVKEELGVLPNRVVDLLALAGDTSDNVPGVSGIGKKTAAELINEFGPLEKILELAPLIKQTSRREKLIEGQNLALLSKKLVTINDQVPLDCEIADLQFSDIHQERTRALFVELDFNRLLSDTTLFKGGLVASYHTSDETLIASAIDRSQYRAVTNHDVFLDVIEKLKGAKKIALACVSDVPNSPLSNLVGIALSWAPNQACYLPLAHASDVVTHQLNYEIVREHLRQIFLDKTKILVAHNAKFDHQILARHGFGEFNIGGDPMLASYLLHQDQDRHSVDDLSKRYLKHKPIALEEVCGIKKTQISFDKVPLTIATEYAAEKADLALRLEGLLADDLENASLIKLYADLELPLEEVLSRMERTGVKIDAEVLFNAGRELKERLFELEARAHDVAGVAFNLASPKKTAEILFEKLALPTAKKTKTGYSTDSSVLEKLVHAHPLPGLLLEHRACAKLINTYIETLPALIDKKTGRIHTNYNQFVTATGRLSSSEPNLQNIPARTKEGRRIRQAFVAEPGNLLISLDYSQVELRLLAFVSKDAVLLDSFAKDQDVHRRTASEIFDVPQDAVTKDQRNAAKTINFGLLYGMGSLRLSQTLGISRKEAEIYLAKYFEKYRGVFAWKNEALLTAREQREVRTLFGRRRALPELASRNVMEQARGERIAINTPIQGTAADIIKKAMIDTDRYLSLHHHGHLIMQVHDELVIEAKKDQAETIANDVAKIMSTSHGLDLNLKVEFGIAENWDAAH